MELSKIYEAIIRNYINAYNNIDVDGMLADMHPDVVFENHSGGVVNLTLNGIEAFRQQAEKAKHLFASRHQQIVQMVPYNQTVEVDIKYNGVLAVDIPGGPKQGDSIALQGKSLFQFANDKIIRLTDIS